MINKTKKEIITCLRYYTPTKEWNLNDWDIIIKRCVEVEDNIFQFKTSFCELYFDKDLHPVSYDKFIVCERKNNNVYFDFEKDLKYRTEPPVPLGEYYWQIQYGFGD